MKRITLSDIAKMTGYSINTVSHALNDKNDISEKTKAEIKKAAVSLGYIGNSSASFLRSGKSRAVAVIIPDIANPHFSIMIKEMQLALRNAGYTAVVFNTDEDEKNETDAIMTSLRQNVDGIIICPVQKTGDNIEYLEKCGVPFVLIGRCFDKSKHSYVVCDNKNGGFLAGKEAIRVSCGKPVLFLNASSFITTSRERLDGIKQAFEVSGIPLSNLTVYEVSPMLSDDGDIAKILSGAGNYGAVICFSDLLAMKVCMLLRRMSLEIPKDISIIGFDDIVSKFALPIMLSSVSSSKTLMSSKAVEFLFELIGGKKAENCRAILPTELVKRETTKNI